MEGKIFMKILVCGYGNIGKHIYIEFEKLSNSIVIYDKYKEPYNDGELLNKYYDYVFVCVPTEMNEDGSADTSEVEWIVNRLNAETIIIRSAIPIGTCEKMRKENIIISPEYYGTTQHSLDSPNFAILGGNKDYAIKVAQLYSNVKNGSFRFIFTDYKTAELAKYMENCWLATKVTFCNEFASIAEQFGINYEELRECFIADERVNPSHTFVYKDKPYYDSHCLNKDIPALINTCQNNNIITPLMSAVKQINTIRKGR